MFDNLKTLTIEGKSVAKLSINGITVWESLSGHEEETNEYGTTVIVNRYTEEANDYGTTAII